MQYSIALRCFSRYLSCRTWWTAVFQIPHLFLSSQGYDSFQMGELESWWAEMGKEFIPPWAQLFSSILLHKQWIHLYVKGVARRDKHTPPDSAVSLSSTYGFVSFTLFRLTSHNFSVLVQSHHSHLFWLQQAAVLSKKSSDETTVHYLLSTKQQLVTTIKQLMVYFCQELIKTKTELKKWILDLTKTRLKMIFTHLYLLSP